MSRQSLQTTGDRNRTLNQDEWNGGGSTCGVADLNRLLFWITCLLWLQVWHQTRIATLAWPSWEAAGWLGCMMGVIGVSLHWLATSGRNGLVRSLCLIALTGLSSYWTAAMLPGTFANRFWVWLIWCSLAFGLMWAAVATRRLQIQRSLPATQDPVFGLRANQISIAGWFLLTAGLGALFSLGRHLTWSADVALTAGNFFLLPSMIWAWFTYRNPSSVLEKGLTILSFAGFAAGWSSFWATSITEHFQLTVMVVLQAAFVLASPPWKFESTNAPPDFLDPSPGGNVSILPFHHPAVPVSEAPPG
jgi:hypothetical protein